MCVGSGIIENDGATATVMVCSSEATTFRALLLDGWVARVWLCPQHDALWVDEFGAYETLFPRGAGQ